MRAEDTPQGTTRRMIVVTKSKTKQLAALEVPKESKLMVAREHEQMMGREEHKHESEGEEDDPEYLEFKRKTLLLARGNAPPE